MPSLFGTVLTDTWLQHILHRRLGLEGTPSSKKNIETSTGASSITLHRFPFFIITSKILASNYWSCVTHLYLLYVLMWCRRLGLDMLLCFCLILSVLLCQLLLHQASVLCSIVGATAAALHPQHVERHSAVCLAVIAHYLWQRRHYTYELLRMFRCIPDSFTLTVAPWYSGGIGDWAIS